MKTKCTGINRPSPHRTFGWHSRYNPSQELRTCSSSPSHSHSRSSSLGHAGRCQSVTAPDDLVGTAVAAWTVDALLKDKEKLTAILVYHVVSGRVDGLHG